MFVEKWVLNDKVVYDIYGDFGLFYEMIINYLVYFKGIVLNYLLELVKLFFRFCDFVNVISYWFVSV